MKNLEFVAKDISCNHCKMTIENGFGGVAGVSSVAVDVDSKKVAVVIDETKTKVDEISSQLEKLGYPAELISAQ